PVARVRALLEDKRFDFNNPNRIRALVAGFVRSNPSGFHAEDGSGYQLLVYEILRVDAFNPQMAAALTGLLMSWRRYSEPAASGMRDALQQIGEATLSPNTREMVDTGLA